VKKTASIVTFLLGSCIMIAGQSYPPNVYVSTSGSKRSAQEVEAMKRLVDLQRGRSLILEINKLTTGNLGRNSTVFSKNSTELMNKAKKYVVPDREVQTKYADFLKLPNTGIVKLVSQKSCSTISGSDKKEKFSEYLKRCAPDFIRGNGKYFSFRQKEYVDEDLADIGFMNNRFFSLGWMNQGILVVLGDADIQDLSLTSKGIDYLTGFAPSFNLDGASKEFGQFEEGLKVNDLSYRKIVDIEKDKTYALRVIAYNSYFLIEKNGNEPKPTIFFPLKEDKREDVIVVFRVVEKNEDGSIILLWRELQRKPSPEIMISTIKTD
jgi:hypothetical protein